MAYKCFLGISTSKSIKPSWLEKKSTVICSNKNKFRNVKKNKLVVGKICWIVYTLKKSELNSNDPIILKRWNDKSLPYILISSILDVSNVSVEGSEFSK